jgi:hypothetical protein
MINSVSTRYLTVTTSSTSKHQEDEKKPIKVARRKSRKSINSGRAHYGLINSGKGGMQQNGGSIINFNNYRHVMEDREAGNETNLKWVLNLRDYQSADNTEGD